MALDAEDSHNLGNPNLSLLDPHQCRGTDRLLCGLCALHALHSDVHLCYPGLLPVWIVRYG